MKDPRDDKLDRLLRSRRVEPASPDLTRRIILEARRHPQHHTVSLRQWIRQLCAEFHLPKPAYVFASALVLGMVLGFNLPGESEPRGDDETSAVQSFLSPDEGLL